MGESFGIPAGNTAERFVWWRYNGGGANSVLEAGPTIPVGAEGDARPPLTDDDIVLLINKNGVPFRVQSSNFLDGDLLVDGSVAANALAANAVTTQHLLAEDALIDALSVTGEFVAAQVEANGLKIGTGTWNDQGFDIPDVVHFPVDGNSGDAQVLAKMVARTLTIENYFSLRGQINSIETGARMMLDAGVTDPAAQVTMTPWWSSERLSSAGDVSGKVGLEVEVVGGVINWYTLRKGTDSYVYIEQWANGALVRSKAVYNANMSTNNATPHDLVIYGNYIYTLQYDSFLDRYSVFRTPKDLSLPGFTTDKQYEVGTGFSATKSLTLMAGAGRSIDSFDLRVFGSGSGDYRMKYLTFPATTFTGLETIAAGDASNYGGAVRGIKPPGYASSASDYVVFPKTADARPYDFVNETLVTAEKFPRASGRNVEGACKCPYSAASFSTIDQYGTIWHYTNARWNNDIAHTWYDSDPAGTGVHETAFSPRRTMSGYGGAFMDLSVPPPPDNGESDGADSVGWYISTTPGGTLARIQYGTPGARTLRVRPDVTASGVPTASFAGANVTPGEIRSTASDAYGPINRFGGSGSGRAGPFEWNTAGQLIRDLTDGGWVNFTATKGGSTPFPNTSATTVSRARYRRWGPLVEVNIVVTSGAAYNPASADHANQSVVTGIPAIACPDQNTPVSARYGDQPCSVVIQANGNVLLVGSARPSPAYAAGDVIELVATYFAA
jgi:hypothetical protein